MAEQLDCAECGNAFLRLTNTRYCSDMCRWLAKVDQSGDCWLWLAKINRSGYGMFGYGGGGRKIGAHRFAYIAFVGPIPDGLQIDHLCRVRSCVNPAHLEAVTPRENTLRGLVPIIKQNVDTCRSGRHPWPESAVERPGRHGKTGLCCGDCRREADRLKHQRYALAKRQAVSA